MNANGHGHSDHWPPTRILQSPRIRWVTSVSPSSESSGGSGQHQPQRRGLDNPFAPCGVKVTTADCFVLKAEHLIDQEAIPDHISPVPLEIAWLTFCFSGCLLFPHGTQGIPTGPLVAHPGWPRTTHSPRSQRTCTNTHLHNSSGSASEKHKEGQLRLEAKGREILLMRHQTRPSVLLY